MTENPESVPPPPDDNGLLWRRKILFAVGVLLALGGAVLWVLHRIYRDNLALTVLGLVVPVVALIALSQLKGENGDGDVDSFDWFDWFDGGDGD